MAKEPTKPTPQKSSAKRPTARRTARVRTEPQGPIERLMALSRSRSVAWGVLITVMFGLVTGLLAGWSREQPLLSIGRVADETRTVRVPFSVVDRQRTERDREQARQKASPVFTADEARLGELRASIEGLPRTLAAAESLDQVDEGIRERFGLSEAGLAAVRAQSADGEPSQAYLRRVDTFWQILLRHPLLDQQTWQRVSDGQAGRLLLLSESRDPIEVDRDDAINVEANESLRAELIGDLARAGFDGPLREVILNRLINTPRPTYRLDTAATALAQTEAAEAVETVVNDWLVGAPIFTRGDVLTQSQIDLLRAEMSHYKEEAPRWRVWLLSLIHI